MTISDYQEIEKDRLGEQVSANLNQVKRPNQRPIALIAIIFIAFIALGMPDGLLGVAWPSIRADFSLPLDSIGALLFASMTGYLTSSFFSGALGARFGVGKVLIFSCFVTGVGLIGYTLISAWWMMVALGLLAGLGAGGIDSNLNAYVASRFGPGLMQWLHAFYGVGVTTGPLIMTWFLSNFQKWRSGYLLVGAFQLLLTIVFTVTLPLWVEDKNLKSKEGEKPVDENKIEKPSLWQTLRKSETLLGVLQFFIYTGCEVALGTWAYSLMTEGRGVATGMAGLIAGSFWFLFTVGRILAGLAAHKLNIRQLVMACMTIALVGAVILSLNISSAVSAISVGIIGFAYAPIFPGMVSGTEDRVGRAHLSNAIGMQTAAAGLGGTIIASTVGVLARHFGLNVVPYVLTAFLALLLLVYLLSIRTPVAN